VLNLIDLTWLCVYRRCTPRPFVRY